MALNSLRKRGSASTTIEHKEEINKKGRRVLRNKSKTEETEKGEISRGGLRGPFSALFIGEEND